MCLLKLIHFEGEDVVKSFLFVSRALVYENNFRDSKL